MLTYDLDNFPGKTKTLRLYNAIRADIAQGVLADGEKLPSRRDLAEHLGISVITVENAYRMLESEGYVSVRPRSGYYVNHIPLFHASFSLQQGKAVTIQELLKESSASPLESPTANPETQIYSQEKEPSAQITKKRTEPFKIRLLAENSPAAPQITEESKRTDMANTAVPDTLPTPTMAKYVRRILADHPGIMLQKPPHLGCAVLRNEIALYLQRFRGMQVQPANILIGSGAEYLYGIIVQLLGRDKLYGIEDPSYQKIRLVYEANGAATEPLPMGPDGILDEALENAKADILHVSPFHSYPSGVTASPAKRHAYLAFAARKNAVIVEEDFDSEFTFFKKPMETLYSLDGEGRVIYMNTFSKSIAPGMRIAYMVLPDHLLAEYEARLGFYSCTVPVFDQYVLAAFIADGGFERHLGRIRRAKRHL